MGNTETFESANQNDLLQWERPSVHALDRNLYGNARFEKIDNHNVIVKHKNVEDQQTLKIIEKYLNSNIVSSGIFSTKKVQLLNNKNKFCGSCANNTQVRLEFWYYRRNLYKEIDQRKKFNDFYKEAEIWFIIKSIAKMEWILASKLKIGFHQNISPRTIFITEGGEIKFLDPFLIETTHSPYAQNLLGLSKNSLPPELFSSLKMYQPEPNFDKEKAEVWMIGIVALSVATLIDYELIYDFNNFDVNTELLGQLQKQIAQSYSPLLRDLIKLCLKPEPQERCDLETINKFLSIREGY